MLLALALRNTMLQLRPFSDKDTFWVLQFMNFFDVVDFGVPGYVLPQLKVDLHIHLTNVLLNYDHSNIISYSLVQLQLEIGSCDLSAVIMKDIVRLKFECLLQDTKLVLFEGLICFHLK